ncbi:MAG: hypothetical protein AABW49_00075 [Nanoarchaeota archaeon]
MKTLKLVIIVVVFLIIVAVFLLFKNSKTFPEIPQDGITFEVTIPENTPEGDTVWIYIWQTPYKMTKISDYTYSVTINESNIFDEGYDLKTNNNIRYRYSRNRYGFRTAEYLAPTPEEPDRDTETYYFTKQGREVAYGPGKIQKDRIKRWRWFPNEGMPVRISSIIPNKRFLPRINNIMFRSGQTIEDFYDPSFREFFNSTSKHIKEQGYTWVEIDPPWQWSEEDGLPKIINDFTSKPNYPDDKIFLEEVTAYKNKGLHVLIAPQVCCTPIDTINKSEEWWDSYFEETEKFLVHFAKLAEQADADAFMYAVPSLIEYPKGFAYRWGSVFRSIRTVFTGEMGEMVWILGPEVSAFPKPIPDAEFISWADELDFILVSTDFPLSTKDNPSDKELEEGAQAVVESVKEFYDKLGKPVIIRNGYFNVKYSWKGQTFYQINSVPWLTDPEEKLKESGYEFDTLDHDRTINAYFQVISENPWVIGYYHFGYTHWENPLSPWMSVRGKPAEDLWKKWNNVIYGN